MSFFHWIMAPLAGGSHSSLSIDAFLLESFQVWVARPRFCLVNVLDRISDPDFDTSNRSYPKDLKKSPNTEDFEYKSRLPESTRAVYLVNVKLMAKAVQQLKQIIIDKVKLTFFSKLNYYYFFSLFGANFIGLYWIFLANHFFQWN